MSKARTFTEAELREIVDGATLVSTSEARDLARYALAQQRQIGKLTRALRNILAPHRKVDIAKDWEHARRLLAPRAKRGAR